MRGRTRYEESGRGAKKGVEFGGGGDGRNVDWERSWKIHLKLLEFIA